MGGGMRFSDPVWRKIVASRLRRLTTSAIAPGSVPARQEAAAAASDVADTVVALLIREALPDDELANALADYFEARSEGFGGWRT